ncbi:hypothetical protein B296_00055453 [Ensete ventricosum]|uniref:Uncharacterized protein n=1 Tax=Ensete ventricosum TaxID=4639 RepID=A0A426XZL9_ENSVE|nr:hypothetical protein B296_00055453 [Ensete ventricosum]
MCGGWYGKHRDIALPQSLPRSRSRVTRIKAKDRSRRNRIKRLEASGIEGEWAADQNQSGESGGERERRKLGFELRRLRRIEVNWGRGGPIYRGRTESCRFRIRGTLSRGSYKDRSCARYYWPLRVGPTRVRLPKLRGTRWPWSGEYHVE